jgi:hypothetical protein
MSLSGPSDEASGSGKVNPAIIAPGTTLDRATERGEKGRLARRLRIMPTLIRLFIFLLLLAGLGFGGMVALTLFVKPAEKEITIRIPARDLVPPADGNDPLGINALPDPVGIVSTESSAELLPPVSALASSEEGDETITTVEPPPE